jgi:uncharacterized membrane protein HdeD (DUF308 family)
MTTNNLPQRPTGSIDPKKGGVWSGVLFVALGLGAIFLPFFSSIVLETWIGLTLASAGLGGLVYAIQTKGEEGFIWKLILSILYIGTGVFLFVYPLTGVLTLTLMVGSFLLSEGIFELILGFQVRPQYNWGWVLLDGLLTIAFGAIVLFQWPGDATWLLGTIIGASLISTGTSRLVLHFSHAKNSPAIEFKENSDTTTIVNPPSDNPGSTPTAS